MSHGTIVMSEKMPQTKWKKRGCVWKSMWSNEKLNLKSYDYRLTFYSK